MSVGLALQGDVAAALRDTKEEGILFVDFVFMSLLRIQMSLFAKEGSHAHGR